MKDSQINTKANSLNKIKVQMILTMIAFGSIGLVVKYIPLGAGQIALSRGVLGSLFLLIFSIFSKEKIRWDKIAANLKFIIPLGIFMGFNWAFLFESYKYTSVSVATICYYFSPILVAVLSVFLLKEKLSKIKIICVISAAAGLIFVAGNGLMLEGSENIIGISFGLASALFYAAIVLTNKFVKDINDIEITFGQLSFSLIVLIPYVYLRGGFDFTGLEINSFIALLVVGLFYTGFLYLIYFSSIRKLDGQTVATLSYLDPISAVIFSSIILHEAMSIMQIIGGVLIIGAAFVNEVYGDRETNDNGLTNEC